jgi:hypothetical protein
LASRGMFTHCVPSENMYQFMLSMGASAGVQKWIDELRRIGSGSPTSLNYALVGIPTRGPGNGFETITHANYPGRIYHTPDFGWVWSGAEAPLATLLVSLRSYQFRKIMHSCEILYLKHSKYRRIPSMTELSN